MALGWILIGGFIVFVLLLLAKDEYYDRQEKKKRMELRAEIVWPVIISTEVEVLQGRTINISASGALLCCPDQLSLNEIVRLTMKPPIRAQLEITAEVVRTNVQCSEDDDPPEGVAVRFIIISEKDRQFISFSVYDHLRGERFPDQSLYSPANPSQKARTLMPKSGR
ncbi:MAG: PilZ domain-containing protein [Syntrophobacteria bacterium]